MEGFIKIKQMIELTSRLIDEGRTDFFVIGKLQQIVGLLEKRIQEAYPKENKHYESFDRSLDVRLWKAKKRIIRQQAKVEKTKEQIIVYKKGRCKRCGMILLGQYAQYRSKVNPDYCYSDERYIV